MRFSLNDVKSRCKNIFRRSGFTAVAAALLFSGFGCQGTPQAVLQRIQPLTLKYWRVYDTSDDFSQIFAAYQKLHPNISIDYRTFTYDEYEKQILNALAEGQGPDIISIQNTEMHRWQPFLLPAPATLSIPFRETQGTIKKTIVTVLRNEPGESVKQLANDFVDVVSSDVVIPTQPSNPKAAPVPEVYGLPLSVDTLALYYNKDILNRAGIAQPAADWKTFQDQVKTITKLDQTGAIIQSAAAIGTAGNVERASDILSLLMMQNGAPMTDQSGTVTFDQYPPDLAGTPEPPGASALIFYTDFANPVKEVYTWNDQMPDSLQAFANGQTAFFFGYAFNLPQIRQANPKLNFGIAPFPQIAGNKPVNFANYWVEAVSNKTAHPDEAWDFVQFMTNADNVQSYLKATDKPTALRSLISGQLDDLDLSVFASQLPTAESWYHGTDENATEQAMLDMINQSLAATSDPKQIVQLGATKVNQTIK
jgi:multiple sugar transport system substrate-binding protein